MMMCSYNYWQEKMAIQDFFVVVVVKIVLQNRHIE